jgi:hypothetical protein
MKLKKAFLFLTILTNIGCVYAQRGYQNLQEYDYEPYHFGFVLGINQMGFAIQQNISKLNQIYDPSKFNSPSGQSDSLTSVEPVPTVGFTIGIVGNLRIADHFDLRFIPSLSFGERELNYNSYLSNQTIPGTMTTEQMSIKSTMLEFPLDIKYKGTRINNARPYIIGGLKYVMDLSSDEKKANDTNGPYITKLKQSDLYGELGAGFDLYFDWFKMGIEAKMSYGLRDVLVRDNTLLHPASYMYTTSVSRLGSKIFQLSFTFE